MGASSGIILTQEALARLRVKKGDTLFLPEAPAGGHRLTPYNPNFARQMALAEECIVSAKPTGIHARRTWFLYEWLTGRTLDVPEFLASMKYVTVMEPNKYLTGKGTRSPRHHVINNLPGTPDFCPIVARTPLLDWYAGMDLAAAAARAVEAIPSDLLSRAAAFLLLEDSKASYFIEGENPPQSRLQRWSRAIGEAGKHPLDTDELLRLQRIVIVDKRLIAMGLRREGGFIGEHDRRKRSSGP